MVGSWFSWGQAVLAEGRIWDRYGALQHDFVRCKKEAQLSLFFN
jgi:hypothetical protein